MSPDRRQVLQGLAGGLVASACARVAAADKAAVGEIVLGQSAPLSGALAKTTRQFNLGAQAWLKEVNGRGGVDGRSLRGRELHARLVAWRQHVEAQMPAYRPLGLCE